MAILQPLSIQGWKWLDIEDAQADQIKVKDEFGLPIDPDLYETTDAFSILENLDSTGAVLFYYTPYTYPSQLNQSATLGDPLTFDINIEIPAE